MGTGTGGAAPQRAGWPTDDDLRYRRLAWTTAREHVEADLARTVTLLETIAQVETDVARTLRATARQAGGEAGERRLKLAGQAVRRSWRRRSAQRSPAAASPAVAAAR